MAELEWGGIKSSGLRLCGKGEEQKIRGLNVRDHCLAWCPVLGWWRLSRLWLQAWVRNVICP
jgi:hypothetical protein